MTPPMFFSRAAWVALLVLLLTPGLGAKDKEKDKVSAPTATEEPDTSSVSVRSTGSVETETSLAWYNAGTASATDWRAAHNGLKFGLDAEGSLDFTFRDLPGLATGALVHLDGTSEANTKSPSGSDPYLVVADVDATALASWYLGTTFQGSGVSQTFRVTADTGVRLLDLSDADTAYLPSGADAEAFWFRVLPVVGSSQRWTFSPVSGAWMLRAQNQLLLWWDAETSYGRNWNLGFQETPEIVLSAHLVRQRSFDWDAELSWSQDWDSGIVLPSVKNLVGLRTSLEAKKAGRLRLTPAFFQTKADLPSFLFSRAQDVENLLGGKVDWLVDLGSVRWGCALEWPWAAWDAHTAQESLKEWKLTCRIDLLD
jgi:hypothetical protein